MEIKKIIEALLFAASEPMTVKQLQQLFPETELPDTRQIQTAIDAIVEDYSEHSVELKRLASGYCFQIKAEFSPWVSRLFEERPPRYSRALLETLAIIAYKQPVTRTDIEEIRAVSVSSHIISTLIEREWIHCVGHKQTPGLPALFGTTRQFLDYFNLSALSQLPKLVAQQDWDLVMANLTQKQQAPSELQINPQIALPDIEKESSSAPEES